MRVPVDLICKTYVFVCDLVRCAHAAKSEDMRGETLQLELRRQYHCSAYNTLVALISCTQTDQKFYVGFLFTENAVKV